MRNKIRQYVWLVMFFLCLLAGIHQTLKLGFSKSYLFFVFAIFAFGFYWIRKIKAKNDTKE
jgi:apolipoprotein N-acyltransferase